MYVLRDREIKLKTFQKFNDHISCLIRRNPPPYPEK